jgi:protein TonB
MAKEEKEPPLVPGVKRGKEAGMPSDLFGDVTHGPRRLGSPRWYTLPLSIATHGAAIAAVLVIPLLATVESPQIRQVSTYTDITLRPPMPPPAPRGRATPRPARDREIPGAPTVAPPTIGPERLPIDESLATSTGDPNGVIGGLDVAPDDWAPPPRPELEPPRGPLPISSGIRPPRKIVHVNPVYPAIALSARAEGTVVIEAIIGPTGRVERARVVTSRPLLDEAALAAVKQWVYTPTLLNNTPVSVILTVSVAFRIP